MTYNEISDNEKDLCDLLAFESLMNASGHSSSLIRNKVEEYMVSETVFNKERQY